MTSKCVQTVCVAAVVQAMACAQSAWTQVSSSGPSPRFWHAMVFDSQRSRTVLFGGMNPGGMTSLSDTWEWDGTAWTQVATFGPPSSTPLMTYDSLRGRTVLVVPVNGGSETWEWDGLVWTPRHSGSTPAAAGLLSALTYDIVRGRTVLWSAGSTWEWDGTSWTSMVAAGPTSLIPVMSYDSLRGTAVLHGGASTWERVSGDWILASQSGPTRVFAPMVFDSSVGRTVMFGGSDAYMGGTSFADTWTWNGSVWSAAAGFGPTGRRLHAMAFDSARGRTVLFGGWDGLSFPATGLADTWEFFGTLASASTYGTACGAPAVTIAPHPTSLPVIGRSQLSDISNAKFGFAAVVWGLTSQTLSLDFLGINGCTLLNGGEMEVGSFCASTSFTSAQHSLAIPFEPALRGVHAYVQAWTLAPGFNPLGIAMSNGIELVIGDV